MLRVPDQRQEGDGGEGTPTLTGATCLYAIYDPVSRLCTMARAGHLEPIIVHPDGRAHLPGVPAGPPLGLGGLPYESTEVSLPEGSSIAFRLTGPLVREIDVAVDGRAKQVDHLDNPTATLTTDSTTFIMLACGRIDPQAQIDSGAVSWTGDAELGERAARNLRFTM